MFSDVPWSDKKGLVAFPLFLILKALSRWSMPVRFAHQRPAV